VNIVVGQFLGQERVLAASAQRYWVLELFHLPQAQIYEMHIRVG
jgi:hypothetical protein